MLAKPGEVTPTNLDWPALKELIARYVTLIDNMSQEIGSWQCAVHQLFALYVEFFLERVRFQIFNKRIPRTLDLFAKNKKNMFYMCIGKSILTPCFLKEIFYTSRDHVTP